MSPSFNSFISSVESKSPIECVNKSQESKTQACHSHESIGSGSNCKSMKTDFNICNPNSSNKVTSYVVKPSVCSSLVHKDNCNHASTMDVCNFASNVENCHHASIIAKSHSSHHDSTTTESVLQSDPTLALQVNNSEEKLSLV